MASPLGMLRRGVRGMDLGQGLVGYGLNAGAAYGAGRAIGFAYNKYPDKNVPRWTAIGGKLAAVLTAVATGGPSIVSGLFDTTGNSALAILGLEHQMNYHREKNGIKVVAIPRSAALPAGGREITRLGELPQAQGGVGMPWQRVFEMAEMP